MNFAFSVRLGGVDYDVGLSNLIVAGFLFLGPLFVFIMALRGFRAARRALFKKSPTLSPTTISHPPHTANKLVRQAMSGLFPVAYYLYLFVVCFWLVLEGLNLILVATARIFSSLGHIFFIGHAFLDNAIIFLLYFRKPGRYGIIGSTVLALLVAGGKTVALVLLYGLEDPCESCPIFFPSPKAFYTDLVFASAYAALLFIQIVAGSVLSRAKAKVESGQNFNTFDSYTVRFCSKIKARPALVPWLAYLLSIYGGSVFGSSLVLFHNIDAGLCVMHAMIYVYVVPYCFLLWFILRRDADHLRRRKLRNQRIKARQAQDPLIGDRYSIQQIRLKKEGDDDDGDDGEDIEDDIEVKRRLNRSNGGRGSDDDDEDRDTSVTDVSEYDPGSFLFPSARVVRFGKASQPSPPFVEDYDHQHQRQRQSPLAASTAAALVGSVGNNSRAGGGSVDREREAAVALNQSLRQILRERTVPIRLMESRSVRFLRKIGVGGYGEVYLAEWEGIEVAVKRFVSERPEKNFLKEIEVISRLDHPNILAFIGAIVEPSYQCLITEYVPLGNVFQWLHAPRAVVTPQQQKKVALDTAKGMLYLHTRNPPIIHRDLKPMNLLITQDWMSIKICDFGLSRPKLHTQAMSRTGTVQWVAPEILRELPYNEKCDVFSYAVVLWELYTRNIPWHKVGAFRVANDVAYQGQRLPLPDDCPRKLAALIEFCWDANPDVRPSFVEIVQTIEEMDEEVWLRKDVVQ